jgi:hypothetical protein
MRSSLNFAARITLSSSGLPSLTTIDTCLVAILRDRSVHPLAEEVYVEEARPTGPVHVRHQILQRLALGEILVSAGFSKALPLTQVMTLNRLIELPSELAISYWVDRGALGDILKKDFTTLNKDRLHLRRPRYWPSRKNG